MVGLLGFDECHSHHNNDIFGFKPSRVWVYLCVFGIIVCLIVRLVWPWYDI